MVYTRTHTHTTHTHFLHGQNTNPFFPVDHTFSPLQVCGCPETTSHSKYLKSFLIDHFSRQFVGSLSPSPCVSAVVVHGFRPAVILCRAGRGEGGSGGRGHLLRAGWQVCDGPHCLHSVREVERGCGPSVDLWVRVGIM